MGSLFTWLVDHDELAVSPAIRIKARRAKVSQTQELQAQAIPFEDLRRLWGDDRHRLRDRAFWALTYSAAGHAVEVLSLDVEDLDLANSEAQIIAKGGDAQRLFWDSEAARLLNRLVAGRRCGPVFLADRARPRPGRQPWATSTRRPAAPLWYRAPWEI